MRYRYLSAALLAIQALTLVQAQTVQNQPKLIVSITIDQLRTEYLEQYASLYGEGGFRKLMTQGKHYTDASCPFFPADRASAVATLITGTTPHYHGITAQQWLDRKSLRPVSSVYDKQYTGIYTLESSSPQNLLCSTLGDELKMSSQGKAVVYGIAPSNDAAILSAGHAADGAFWIDTHQGSWCTSTYYFRSAPKWFSDYASTHKSNASKHSDSPNPFVTDMALECIRQGHMGEDAITDLLTLTYDASADEKQTKRQDIYKGIDQELSRLIAAIESSVGKANTLFVVTGGSFSQENNTDYERYRIPSGTFYINRTANLLNVYLSAIYGQARYVEGYYSNQIYLNHKLLEEKRLSLNELLNCCEEFLIQNAGVRDVYSVKRLLSSSDDYTRNIRNGYNPATNGDIIIEVAPGWKIQNEETHQTTLSHNATVSFPLFFYGAGVRHERVQTPVTTDRIAPTIAKTIRIRAPNACSAQPLD